MTSADLLESGEDDLTEEASIPALLSAEENALLVKLRMLSPRERGAVALLVDALTSPE